MRQQLIHCYLPVPTPSMYASEADWAAHEDQEPVSTWISRKDMAEFIREARREGKAVVKYHPCEKPSKANGYQYRSLWPLYGYEFTEEE